MKGTWEASPSAISVYCWRTIEQESRAADARLWISNTNKTINRNIARWGHICGREARSYWDVAGAAPCLQLMTWGLIQWQRIPTLTLDFDRRTTWHSLLTLDSKYRIIRVSIIFGPETARAPRVPNIIGNLCNLSGVMLYITDLSTKNSENRLPFELQCWTTTHLKGFVELSSLPQYLRRFG